MLGKGFEVAVSSHNRSWGAPQTLFFGKIHGQYANRSLALKAKIWLFKIVRESNTSPVGSGMDFFLDGLDEGWRYFPSLDAAADKFTEALFLAQHFTIGWVGFYFFQHFPFHIGGEFVVKKQVHPLDKILAGLKIFHRSSLLQPLHWVLCRASRCRYNTGRYGHR